MLKMNHLRPWYPNSWVAGFKGTLNYEEPYRSSLILTLMLGLASVGVIMSMASGAILVKPPIYGN